VTNAPTVSEMEKAYSGSARVVTIVAGDFDTDPTDARFVEGIFASLREKFVWAWENILLAWQNASLTL
jgi:hypothetical protein